MKAASLDSDVQRRAQRVADGVGLALSSGYAALGRESVLRELVERTTKVPVERLERLQWTELLQCVAFRRGVPTAVRWVATALEDLQLHLRAAFPAEFRVDDVVSAVRVDLLEGDLLRKFTGRGSFRNWIRVVAVRRVYRALRRSPVADEGTWVDRFVTTSDPELDLGKDETRKAFRRALRAAVLALEPLDRECLRTQMSDQKPAEVLARRHNVHRTTAVRWLAHARHRVFVETRAVLSTMLETRLEETDQVVRSLLSQVELSLPRLLATQASGAL